MPASSCATSFGQCPGLQETCLQTSALDWPTIILSPRKSFCSTSRMQLLGIHALSVCDTVLYLFGKGKKSALKLLEINIPSLDQVFGQPGATQAQLQETAYTFFLPLYGQKGCTTMNDTHAHFYRGHRKPPPLKKLPPTNDNMQLHVLRAHLQMLLLKAADQRFMSFADFLLEYNSSNPKRDPPEEKILYIECSTITPAVSTTPVAPQTFLDVVSCSCTAECRHAVAHAAAARPQAFHARTTANAREETSAVVLSPASRWISKTMKRSQVSMMIKYILSFLVIYTCTFNFEKC